ncbi:MAG: hypothetical protein NT150_01115 [Bacteroidetes bacterium]|nr:hypothetical protein [Bacteroidota bacterium]
MNKLIEKLKEIDADVMVYYDMKDAESEKLLQDIAEYANANREGFISFFRRLTPKEDSCLNIIYQALTPDSKNWGDFFVEETKRIIELAKKSDHPFAVTSCLEELLGSKEIDSEFNNKIIRILEKELSSPVDALRHRCLSLLSYIIQEDNQRNHASVIEKMKALIHDPNWKVRWMANNSLKDYGLNADDIKISIWDKIRGKRKNPYDIEEEGDQESKEEKAIGRRNNNLWLLAAGGYLCYLISKTDLISRTLISPAILITIFILLTAVFSFLFYKRFLKKGLKEITLVITTAAAGIGFSLIVCFFFLTINYHPDEEEDFDFVVYKVVDQKVDNADSCMVTFSFEWENTVRELELCCDPVIRNDKIESITLVKSDGVFGIPVLEFNELAAVKLAGWPYTTVYNQRMAKIETDKNHKIPAEERTEENALAYDADGNLLIKVK